MRRLMLQALLAVALSAAGRDGMAQSQAFVAPTLGTVIHTNNTSFYEIDSVEGSAIRTVGARLAYVPWIAACRNLGSTVEFDIPAADALWPLEVGKKATAETRRGEYRWALSLAVTGRERVTVPAGTFDTWIIDLEETAATQDYKGAFRCWYAPEVGFTVRRRHQVLIGRAPSADFDVTRIERKDRSHSSEFRAPPPGTSFDTSLGSYRIDAAEGPHLIRRSDQEHLDTTWVGGLIGFSSQDVVLDAVKRDFNRLWPIEIGKSLHFDITRPDGAVWSNVLTVERMEALKVPAGIYSAFVIDHRERAANGSYEASYTYWWSPALGFPIKRDVRLMTGTSAPASYELRAVRAPQ